jgi:hypothetical protein
MGSSFVQPTLEGGLGFTGRLTEEEILDAYVLIEIGPVNTLSSPNQPPVLPFLIATL